MGRLRRRVIYNLLKKEAHFIAPLFYFLVAGLPAEPAEPLEPADPADPADPVVDVFLTAAFGAGFLVEFFFVLGILFIVKNNSEISKKS